MPFRTPFPSLEKGKSLLTIVFALFAFGCQSETIFLEAGDPPTEAVRFGVDINPLLQASCSGGFCHIGQSTGGVELTNYLTLIGSSSDSYGGLAVRPGQGAESPLVLKLAPNPQFGDRMPFGKQAFTPSQIELIRRWIDDGALNN